MLTHWLVNCICLGCNSILPAFISHFSHGHFTLAQTTKNSKFDQAPGLANLSLSWAWCGSLPRRNYYAHKHPNISTRARMQRALRTSTTSDSIPLPTRITRCPMETLRGACYCYKFLKVPTWGCPPIALHNTTSEKLTANIEVAPDTKNQTLGIVWMLTLWRWNPPFLRQMIIVIGSPAALHPPRTKSSTATQTSQPDTFCNANQLPSASSLHHPQYTEDPLNTRQFYMKVTQ